MSIFADYQQQFTKKQTTEMDVMEYLQHCKNDKMYYASVYERLLASIGEPIIIDTSNTETLSRIFSNKKIKVYPAFSDFYGIEHVVEKIVAFLKDAARGLEESRNVLYLLGPVGSAKSSIAERIKELIQNAPFYTIKAFNVKRNKWEISPIFESPLGIFDFSEFGKKFEKEYNIHKRYLKHPMSPWAVKRLEEANGDLSKIKVVKLWPSILKQIGVTKIEPGDENNQDISSLVGKVNIRELEEFDQNDPDAYNWAGGLNVSSQGVLDYIEIFKSPLKVLHPLLSALQEGHYNGTEQFGAIPFQGLIIAHSNQTEWETFKNEKKNEAFLDRITTIKVPYCLRYSEEIDVYNKLIENSDLKGAPTAPGTLEMMAQYSVLTRLKETENSNIFTKMEVYDGKNMKSKDPNGKSYEEYKDLAGVDEGMTGSSTRFAYKILSKVYSFDADETAANPIHLMNVLERQIIEEQFPKEEEEKRLNFINDILKPKYYDFLEVEIQRALVESYSEFGQNMMERYYTLADAWCDDKDYRDVNTNELYDREAIDKELSKIEKPAGISNPKDFRNEIVKFILRYRGSHDGKFPSWTSYEKISEVIEKQILGNLETMLPIISFGKKASEDDEKKHQKFVSRMMEKGYTEKQIRISVESLFKYKKHN